VLKSTSENYVRCCSHNPFILYGLFILNANSSRVFIAFRTWWQHSNARSKVIEAYNPGKEKVKLFWHGFNGKEP